MTDATEDAAEIDRRILAILAQRRELTISGNRESYSELRFRDGRWFYVQGDPLEGSETEYGADESTVLSHARGVVRNAQGIYGPDRGEVTQAEVLAWIEERWRF